MVGSAQVRQAGRFGALLAAACLVGVVAAGEPGYAQEQQRPQQSWPAGFYRRISSSTIRWIASDGRMCTVMNRDQLTAFGGDGIVRVVGDRSTFDRGRVNTGICPWPDGIYRESRWSGIWQALYSIGNQRYYCNITTQQHLQAFFLAEDDKNPVILTVPNRSRLGFKRQWAGDCTWPAAPDSEP